jgi:hypothetical protein
MRNPLLLAMAAGLLFISGCTIARSGQEDRIAETVILLDDADFKVTTVHAVGQAKKDYFFFIKASGPSEPRSAAWKKMKESAGIEGGATQWINVTEESTKRWFFFPFYYQLVYTVSADAITFD